VNPKLGILQPGEHHVGSLHQVGDDTLNRDHESTTDGSSRDGMNRITGQQCTAKPTSPANVGRKHWHLFMRDVEGAGLMDHGAAGAPDRSPASGHVQGSDSEDSNAVGFTDRKSNSSCEGQGVQGLRRNDSGLSLSGKGNETGYSTSFAEDKSDYSGARQ